MGPVPTGPFSGSRQAVPQSFVCPRFGLAGGSRSSPTVLRAAEEGGGGGSLRTRGWSISPSVPSLLCGTGGRLPCPPPHWVPVPFPPQGNLKFCSRNSAAVIKIGQPQQSYVEAVGNVLTSAEASAGKLESSRWWGDGWVTRGGGGGGELFPVKNFDVDNGWGEGGGG